MRNKVNSGIFIQASVLLIVFFCSAQVIGQQVVSQMVVVPDCDSLKVLKFDKYFRQVTKGVLNGPGMVMEVKDNPKTSKYFFEQEHNTAWYLIPINYDGQFVMNVIPLDKNDDYDFLLFYYSQNFCNDLKNGKIKPVRSNLCRGDTVNKGYTGLNATGKAEFVGQGPGSAYSKPLDVKKGDRLVLVVDNVKSTKGHFLELGYQKTEIISGSVKDDEGKSIKANLEVSDQNGKTVYKGTTDPQGNFSTNIVIWEHTGNFLFLDADSSFYHSVALNTSAKDYNFKDIRTVLPRLRKGKKYSMGLLNFQPGMATLLNECYPNARCLLKLLQKNPLLQISIEGHINAPGASQQELANIEWLSLERANTIFTYLTTNGIDPKRLKTVGHGAKYMIYPYATEEWQMQQNRRVEINVLSTGWEK